MSLVINIQYWMLRVVALLLIPSLFVDLEISFFCLAFIFLHIKLGLKTIILDYIHNRKTKVLYLTLLRLSSIEILRYALELIT